MDLLRAHPYFAAGSFITSGTVAGGLAHHFLDLDAPYAVTAGVATGAAVVAAEGYAYAEYAAFKNWLTGWVGAAGGAVVSAGQATGGAVESALDTLGIGSDHIDLDDVVKRGTPAEAALAKQIQQLMFSGAPTPEKTKQIQDLLAQLNALLAASHDPDAPDHTDASFTTNNDNPAPVKQDDTIMDENPSFAPETQHEDDDDDPVMPKNSAFAPSTQRR